MTIRAAVFDILDHLPPGDISGWKLFDLVQKETGRKPYPPTLLQYAREYARLSGADFNVVDPARSVYHYRPGVEIAGAILD